jgi:hypothetical protein
LESPVAGDGVDAEASERDASVLLLLDPSVGVTVAADGPVGAANAAERASSAARSFGDSSFPA